MSAVNCPSCKSQVQPRLWHYSPWYRGFTYSKTQHICNVCGVCMYETGGGVRPGMMLFTAFIVFPVLMILASIGGWIGIVSTAALIAINFGIMYLVVRFVLRLFKKKVTHADIALPQQASQPQAKSGSATNLEALERLASLKQRGLLSEEEFEAEKRNILSH